MSHEVETMMSVRQTPWHQLGTVLPDYVDATTAMKEAGLDWRVRLEPLQIVNPEWRTASEVPGRAVVRDSDSRVLGCVGTRYTPVQNDALFAIGESICGTGALWETAGSLRGGRQVWALLRVGGADEIVRGDTVQSYLLLTNDHEGYRSAAVYLTTVRTVCANTMASGIRQAGDLGFRFRHTATVEERLRAAGEVLEHGVRQRARVLEVMRGMARVRFTTAEQLAFVMEALGLDPDLSRQRRKVDVAKFALEWEREHAAAGAADTLWTAFNAVTHYASHNKTAVRKGNVEARAASMVTGTLATKTREAFKVARDVVAASQA